MYHHTHYDSAGSVLYIWVTMFRALKHKAVQVWFEDAKMGKTKYVLVKGVLSWGVPMFIVMTILLPQFQGHEDPLRLSRIIVGVVIWGIGGYIFGWWAWRSNLKKYGLTAEEYPKDN